MSTFSGLRFLKKYVSNKCFLFFIMWFNKPELLLTEYDVGIGIFPMKKCHGWRWMCVNPFPSIPGSLFAYSGHNDSLIHRCHLQPTVTLSRMNSCSSGAEKEQRISGAQALYSFHSEQKAIDPFTC